MIGLGSGLAVVFSPLSLPPLPPFPLIFQELGDRDLDRSIYRARPSSCMKRQKIILRGMFFDFLWHGVFVSASLFSLIPFLMGARACGVGRHAALCSQ